MLSYRTTVFILWKSFFKFIDCSDFKWKWQKLPVGTWQTYFCIFARKVD